MGYPCLRGVSVRCVCSGFFFLRRRPLISVFSFENSVLGRFTAPEEQVTGLWPPMFPNARQGALSVCPAVLLCQGYQKWDKEVSHQGFRGHLIEPMGRRGRNKHNHLSSDIL